MIEIAPRCTTVIRCHFCPSACATLLCRLGDSFVVIVHKEKNKKVAAKEKKHFNIKVEFKLEISENKDKERNVLRIK